MTTAYHTMRERERGSERERESEREKSSREGGEQEKQGNMTRSMWLEIATA